MIIDVHSHLASEELLDFLVAHPEYGNQLERRGKGFYAAGYGPLDPPVWDLGLRLASLKKRKIDLQLVGPLNTLAHWPGGAPDVAYGRLINKHTAKMVGQGEGRLKGLAVIAFGSPESAADELRRAVGEYGFVGAHIGISAGARPLDDPIYEPVWSVCEKLGLFVYMHPANEVYYDRFKDFTLNTVILWPTETCVAVSRLICAGVLEQHPRLNLVLSHGGGTLPYLAVRLDRAWEAPKYEYNPALHKHIAKKPSAYLKQICVDTCVFGANQMDFLLKTFGPDRVLFGSDYPFEIGDAEGKKALPIIKKLPKKTQAKIMAGNAARLLAKVRAG